MTDYPTSVTPEAVDFVIGVRYADIPAEAVRLGIRCVLDGMGLIVAGSDEVAVRILAEDAVRTGGREDALLLGNPDVRVPATTAARILGAAGHVHDWDDTQVTEDPRHVYGLLTHPTMPPLAATLAAAQLRKSFNGKDFLLAFLTGFEVECKIAEWMRPDHYLRGMHSSGTVGTFGAFAAAAKVLALSSDSISHGFGIAASMAAGIRCNYGTMMKPLHVGRASENGLMAALLAKQGFEAESAALDGRWGFFAVHGNGVFREKLTEGFGNTWSIVSPGVSIKPYPCGILTHPTMDLMLRLVRDCDLKPDSIETVTVYAGSNILEPIRYPVAHDHFQAKFSLPAELAMIILVRRAGKREFSDEFVRSEAMQAMQSRIRTELDPKIESSGFDKVRSRIVVKLKDGRTIEGTADERYRGGPENPISNEDLEGKVRDCCDGVLFKDAQEQLVESCWNLSQLEDASSLATLLQT